MEFWQLKFLDFFNIFVFHTFLFSGVKVKMSFTEFWSFLLKEKVKESQEMN